MRCKWNFRNEPTINFSEIPAFRPKSGQKPPKEHASLEVFLSCVEKELFADEMNDSTQSNLSGDESKTLRNLADDRSIVINGAAKGSSVVIWDRENYLQKASKQLRDTNVMYTRMLTLKKMFLLVQWREATKYLVVCVVIN